MRYLFIILTLLLDLFLLQGVAVAQTSSQAPVQYSKQNKQQLTLDQIKEKIRVYADSKNEKDKAAIDKAIAAEISSSHVSGFQLSDSILNELRELGAGPQTIKALESLKGTTTNQSKEEDTSSQKIVILVADFSSEDKKDYSVTQLLFDHLSVSTRKYADVEVKALGETLPKRLSRKEIIAKGKEHNATILIWGWLDKSDEAVIISAHFEVIADIHKVALSDSNMLGGNQVFTAGLSELNRFTIQSHLRDELTAITLFATALSRLQAQDYKTAISQFTDALRQEAVPEQMMNVSDIFTARGLAYLYYEGSESKNAVNDFKEAIRANDKNSMAHGQLMQIYFSEDQYDDVIIHSKKLSEYESGIEFQAMTAFMQWYSYLNKNKPEEAQYFFEKLVQMPEGNSPSIFISGLRGLAYAFKEDYKSAIPYFERAMQLRDEIGIKASILGAKGICYLQLKENEKAIKDFEEAVRLDPKQVWIYSQLGAAYLTKKDYKKAIENCSKYLDSIADNVENQSRRAHAFFYRGSAYDSEGNEDEALKDFSSCISLDPRSVGALHSRALIYFNKNQLDEAISDLSEVIKLTPNDADTFVIRGFFYSQKHLLDKALEDYNEAIRLDQNNSWAYLERGILYATQGKREPAIFDLKMALQTTNDPRIRQKAQQRLNLLGVK